MSVITAFRREMRKKLFPAWEKMKGREEGEGRREKGKRKRERRRRNQGSLNQCR